MASCSISEDSPWWVPRRLRIPGTSRRRGLLGFNLESLLRTLDAGFAGISVGDEYRGLISLPLTRGSRSNARFVLVALSLFECSPTRRGASIVTGAFPFGA